MTRHTHTNTEISEDQRFNVLIREDAKVLPFADIRAKAVSTFSSIQLRPPSVGPAGESNKSLPHDRLALNQLG